MSLGPRSGTPLRLVIGCCCLVACVFAVALGAPAYETTVAERAPTEQAMAASLDAYSPSDIAPIAFDALSPGEQTAVAGAVRSPRGVYTDRGRSDDGGQFAYRNDIVTQYFVDYRGSIYLVRVVVDVGYLWVAGGVLAGGVGLLLIASGLRAWRIG